MVMIPLEQLGGFGVMGNVKRFKQHPQGGFTVLDGEVA
jgi:hypothetical protein